MANSASKFIKDDLKLLEKVIVKNVNNFRTQVYQNVGASIRTRIFNFGTATDGTAIGFYKNNYKSGIYKKNPKRKGSQVDMEVSGVLRRSVTSGNFQNRVTFGIASRPEPGAKNFDTVENAAAQEKNFNKDIFAPTNGEVKEGDKVFTLALDKTLKKEYATKHKKTIIKPK